LSSAKADDEKPEFDRSAITKEENWKAKIHLK
jgi:hypothetical protein